MTCDPRTESLGAHGDAAASVHHELVSTPTRVAVRVLLLDSASRVLMFEGRDLSDESDTARWWFTAGGRVEPGESHLETAEREVREETGHSGLELVGPFHRREFDFVNHGQNTHQIEHFFAARATSTAVDTKGWTDLERRAVLRSRWWAVAELDSTSARYYPVNLVELVQQAAELV